MRERKDKSAERRVPPVDIEDRAGVSTKRTLSERSIHSGLSASHPPDQWSRSEDTQVGRFTADCLRHAPDEQPPCIRIGVGPKRKATTGLDQSALANEPRREPWEPIVGREVAPCLPFQSSLQNRNSESYQTSTPSDDNTQVTSRPDFRSRF